MTKMTHMLFSRRLGFPLAFSSLEPPPGWGYEQPQAPASPPVVASPPPDPTGRRARRRRLALVGVVIAIALVASCALGSAVLIRTVFQRGEPQPLPVSIVSLAALQGPVNHLVAGSDGAIWLSESTARASGTASGGVEESFGLAYIARMTTSGAITEVALPNDGKMATGLVLGPDGALWFTEQGTGDIHLHAAPPPGSIGRVTPSGTLTEFPLRASEATSIAAGPDGALWFTEQPPYDAQQGPPPSGPYNIGRITPSGVMSEFAVDGNPGRIVAGPDDALWFTLSREVAGIPTFSIGRITLAGNVTMFPLPGQAYANCLAVGADGNLWFTAEATNVGRITPAGAIALYGVPHGLLAGSVYPQAITAGPDGNVWFVEGVGYASAGRHISRITPQGTITRFTANPLGEGCDEITAGPGHTLWFIASDDTSAISQVGKTLGRITLGADGAPTSDTTGFTQATVSAVIWPPYTAAIPGPGCDKGGASWDEEGDSTTVNCLADSMQLVRGPGAKYLSEANFKWYTSYGNLTIPSVYTISCRVGTLTAQTNGGMLINNETASSYGFLIWDDGTWVATHYSHAGMADLLHQGSLSVRSSYTLATQVSGETVTFLVDGTPIVQVMRDAPATDSISLAVDSGTSGGSATFKDFVFTPVYAS